MNLKPLENILWRTKEGIACRKAIEYFNTHFDLMTKKEIQKKMEIFKEKFDRPLNERWAKLKKQYNIKQGNE